MSGSALALRLSRLKWITAWAQCETALRRYEDYRQKANFDPAQPRDELGRWTGTGSAADVDGDPDIATVAVFPNNNETQSDDNDEVILAAGRGGGLPKAVWNLTVRQFVSRYCEGRINRELPGQFDDVSIADLMELRKGGDAAADKCYKLLNQPRFRKGK